MPHPLQTKVSRVRRLGRIVFVARAIAWAVATMVIAVLTLGFVDWFIASEDIGLRLIYSTAILATLAWAGWRFLLPAWTTQVSDLEVARLIERKHPELQNRLSSALQFIRQESSDSPNGSASLRRRVVTTTLAELEDQSFTSIVRWQRLKWPLAIAISTLMIAVGVGIAFPRTAARGLSRLALPLDQTIPWPRRTYLELVDFKSRVPFGEPYRVEVADQQGRLPTLVQVYYWFEGDEESDVQPQNMKPSGEHAVHQLGRVSRPFKFKVVGGDDHTMPWQQVDVVQPPRIESLEIALHPPKYTGWKQHASSPHLQAIVGTQVVVKGRSTLPLKAARAIVETKDGEQSIPAALSKDALSFEFPAPDGQPWIMTSNGQYRFELETISGLTADAGESYQIHVSEDRAPQVVIKHPPVTSFATANALLPIDGKVNDDLAIASIEMRFRHSTNSESAEEIVSLYKGPEIATPVQENNSREGDSRVIAHQWDLSKLPNLNPGTELELTLAASDYLPQKSLSSTRRIAIISASQFEDRLAQRQAQIIAELAEALRLQRDYRSQAGIVQVQLNEAGRLVQTDIITLQSAELGQRQVRRLLGSEDNGALAQINTLLQLVESNRLDRPEISRRMQTLQTELTTLTKGPLPQIESRLIAALKAGQAALGKVTGDQDELTDEATNLTDASREEIEVAANTQDLVIAKLEELLGGLTKWDNYRRFAREIGHLRGQQERITADTKAMREKTLSRNAEDLSSQERADLEKLNQRQLESARQLEKLLGRMEQMRDELTESSPLSAQALTDTLDTAQRLSPSATMRQAARQVSENQLGQASKTQQQAGTQLDELLDTLAGRREHELDRLVDKLKEAVDEIDALKSKYDELHQQTNQQLQRPDSSEKQRELQQLRREQQQLGQQADKLARRLQRLRAEKAAEHLRSAAKRLESQGQQGASQNDLEDQQQQTQQDLDDAADEARRALKQAEQDLLDEQLARLAQSLEGMILQQQNIISETQRLEQLRVEAGQLTRAQQASAKVLARQQRHLAEEAGDFAEKIEPAAVFHLGLTRAIDEMNLAAGRLQRRQLGATTQQIEQNALTRLEQLVEALQEDENDPPENTGDDSGEANGNAGGQPPDGIRNLAQLKLLKLMQIALRNRTAELIEARQNDQFSSEQQAELDRLATEQGHLADLLFDLSEPSGDNEEPLDNLPEIEYDELDQAIDNANRLLFGDDADSEAPPADDNDKP